MLIFPSRKLGQTPLSGELVFDQLLLENYEVKNKLSSEHFLFVRILGDFYTIATHEREKPLETASYFKIWKK